MDKPKKVISQTTVEDDKIYAAVGYIWILCFVPLLLKKDSAFCQFHGKQALVLFVLEVIGSVVFWIPFFGWLLFILILVLAILGVIKSMQGEYYKLPIVNDLVEKFKI